jgi:uncharacterized protein YbbK (DUF523 family)
MNKVLISACLLGENVRYDGRHNLINHPLLEKLKSENRLVTICPEVAGGLPVPRPYATIARRIPVEVITDEGDDVTPQFVLGAELTAELAKREGCIAALMKADSPACGNRDISGAAFSGKEASGAGIAAQEVIESGIPVFNETEIDRLEAMLEERDLLPEIA